MANESIWKWLVILSGLAPLNGCQQPSLGTPSPLSASHLAEEYERSHVDVRNKYEGKEIIVQGYVLAAASFPGEGDVQGSVLLQAGEGKSTPPVACWFSKDQRRHFSRVRGGQLIAVKGVFTGEAGVELKFCKLLKADLADWPESEESLK